MTAPTRPGRPYVRAGYPSDATAIQKRVAARLERQHDWTGRYYRADGLLEVRIMNINGLIEKILLVDADGTVSDLA